MRLPALSSTLQRPFPPPSSDTSSRQGSARRRAGEGREQAPQIADKVADAFCIEASFAGITSRSYVKLCELPWNAQACMYLAGTSAPVVKLPFVR
ncbi:hypothetical protein Bphy_2151 [Paraburkholderia phymatum STM815]|uniref:Uncharacterized protein n=1 Tax=Paraburkholderia phymatum (strain DSM 17167 / CIP 108236 / LMG 21445 / STM815) TaxID=391038 RepID=B2JEL1_PARP8|nr:hypothetical protein Bphy_2151 [Paraburkholderia phymatum STM815]